MTYNTDLPPLIIPLGQESHAKALELAAEQSTPSVGKRVYLNALAVYAVHSFLQWVEIETDLNMSDSLNPFLSSLLDTADLVLPGIGRLECCPVLPGETACRLVAECQEDLIGYVAVRFGSRLDSVQMLGFAPAVDVALEQEELSLSSLKPLEFLEEYLNRLKDARDFIEEDEDLVAVQVRSLLATTNISEVVAKLEHIYRNSRPMKWRYAGADVLTGSVAGEGSYREVREDAQKNDIQKLAQNLMNKLAQIWGEAE